MILFNEKLLVTLISLSPFISYLGRGLFNTLLVFIACYSILLYKIRIFPLKNEYLALASIFYLLATPLLDIFATYTLNTSLAYLLNGCIVIVFLIILQKVFLQSINHQENIFLFLKIIFYSMSVIATILNFSYFLNLDIFISIKLLKLIPFHHYSYHAKHTFLVAGMAIYLYYFLINKKSFINSLCIGMLILSAFASHGRTAILTMSIGIIIFIYIVYLQNIRKLFKGIILGTLTIISLITISYISSGSMFDINKIHTSGRFDGYVKYINYTLEHNPIFGLGIKGGQLLYENKIIPYKHPHNIIVEAFVSSGFVGVFLLFVLLMSIFIIYIKYYTSCSKNHRALLLSTFAMFLVSSQGFWSLWNKHHLIIMLLYIFMALYIVKTKNCTDK